MAGTDAGSVEADEALVGRAQEGDHEAFRALLARHAGWVGNLMLARLGERGEAEEGMQEVFVRAWERLSDLREPAAFRGWLRTTAGRVASDLRRARLREGNVALDDAAVPSGGGGEGPAQSRERAVAVAKAVEGLGEPDREIVILRYDRGMPLAEIAREIGLTVGAVSMRLTRAHRALAAALGEWNPA